jgi:tetratricopeptide (TPR) repeat protein
MNLVPDQKSDLPLNGSERLAKLRRGDLFIESPRIILDLPFVFQRRGFAIDEEPQTLPAPLKNKRNSVGDAWAINRSPLRGLLNRFFAAMVVFGFVVALPQAVKAHGEVHIRINALTKQIASQPSAQLYLDRAEFHRQDQNWAAAEADYDQAAQIDPQLPLVDFYRARMLADAGRLEAAQTMFGKALERAPNDGESFVGRARVRARLQQHDAARADYERGLELLANPEPEYFVELAQLSAAQGQIEKALQDLDRGIRKLGPTLVLQIPALDFELELKDYQAALARLEAILERAHRKENWLARRGDILLAAGGQADAKKSYEAALATIKTLPRLVQQGPAMVHLQTRVSAALAAMGQLSMDTR